MGPFTRYRLTFGQSVVLYLSIHLGEYNELRPEEPNRLCTRLDVHAPQDTCKVSFIHGVHLATKGFRLSFFAFSPWRDESFEKIIDFLTPYYKELCTPTYVSKLVD